MPEHLVKEPEARKLGRKEETKWKNGESRGADRGNRNNGAHDLLGLRRDHPKSKSPPR